MTPTRLEESILALAAVLTGKREEELCVHVATIEGGALLQAKIGYSWVELPCGRTVSEHQGTQAAQESLLRELVRFARQRLVTIQAAVDDAEETLGHERLVAAMCEALRTTGGAK